MNGKHTQVELDGLRLLGLSRVPACSRCPRYSGLVAMYNDPRRAGLLPDVPRDCQHAFCAPIAARFEEVRVRTLRRNAS